MTTSQLLVSSLIFFVVNAYAEVSKYDGPDVEEKGLAIAKEASLRDDGFMNNRFDMEMLIRNKNGTEFQRKLRVQNLEVENDGNKTLIIFDTPSDQRDTKVLSFSHKFEPDEQMIYIPELKRVKRIASNNRSGPFVGSEFAYEDITSPEVEKYTYKYIGSEECKSGQCQLVELTPIDRNSGYTRLIVWYDSSEYYVVKTDFYDRKNALLKTLSYSGYKKYNERYWRADVALMENIQTGKSTLIRATNWAFQSEMDNEDFTRNGLFRVK